MTINETHVFGPALVNEARVGYNRINISFNPLVVVNPADLGIRNGINFPLALPQIMLGINQTIMMVLSMVIIAGMVGAQGLGLAVVDGMQNNRMGQSVEAGLAIVILAIMLDRLTQALARRQEEKANLNVR